MQIIQDRKAVVAELEVLKGCCVGCTDCKGLCLALADLMAVPDLVLSKRPLRH
jgi:hypothetical protein